jgi:uncharacterized protein
MRTQSRLPVFLQQRNTDEYRPQPYSAEDLPVLEGVRTRLRRPAGARASALAEQRRATAAGLLALNDSWGTQFFVLPPDAAEDPAAAEAAFTGAEPVIDVQTHFLAPHAAAWKPPELLRMYREIMPDWWTELDDVVAYSAAEYIRNVYLETETAVAVLTSGPGLDPADRALYNDEMAAVRALVDEYAGPGRLLNHVVVHADVPAEYEAMGDWVEAYDPVGFKVYTPGRRTADGWVAGWMLDDEDHGLPFLERARSLGVHLICAHKGISAMVDNGSPRDIGPAARAFPELDFVVYHSGYEFSSPLDTAPPEAEFSELTAADGVNRLIATAEGSGVGKGGNIYAELGTTWFSLIRRPREAAHVLGKLIAHLGEDNVIWGTDSIWYGSAQPLVDAFRAFQIPDDLCERFGYDKLTPAVKAKILSGNAARLYGVDLAWAATVMRDDGSWARELLAHHEAAGFQSLR